MIYQNVICEDCHVEFKVMNQHLARVRKCILCKAIADRKRRKLHQKEMRTLKKQNKIVSPAA